MSTLTIRKVSELTHARLRQRAAQSGRSVEAEVRAILDDAVSVPARNFLVELHSRTAALGDIHLEIPARDDHPRPVDLA